MPNPASFGVAPDPVPPTDDRLFIGTRVVQVDKTGEEDEPLTIIGFYTHPVLKCGMLVLVTRRGTVVLLPEDLVKCYAPIIPSNTIDGGPIDAPGRLTKQEYLRAPGDPSILNLSRTVRPELRQVIHHIMGGTEAQLLRAPPEGGLADPDRNPDSFKVVVNVLDLMALPGSGYEWVPLYVNSEWAQFLRQGQKRIQAILNRLTDIENRLAASQLPEGSAGRVDVSPDERAALVTEVDMLHQERTKVWNRMQEVNARMPPYDPNRIPSEELKQRLVHG